MARTRIELAEALYEHFERRDIEGAFESVLAPDVELHLPEIYPDPETFRGRDGLERWLSMLNETWAEWRIEPEELIEAGDRVLAMIRLSARGSESGAPVESKTAHLLDFRGDRIAGVRVYLDRDEGRGAAGLSR